MERAPVNETVGQSRLDYDRVMQRVANDGSLEGDLNGRYSRLRRRIALIEPGEWLYYAGASALKRCPNASRFAAEIVHKLQLPAGILRFEGCSGQDVLALGYEDIARNIAEVVTEQVRAAGACGVICGMEHDRWMFSSAYPRWGFDLAIPVVTASEFFGRLFSEKLVSLRSDTDIGSALFCGSLFSGGWLESMDIWAPVLRAVFGERFVVLQEAAAYIPPENSEHGPARPGPGIDDMPVEVIWEKIAQTGTTLLITDDPFTYEILYDRAFRTGVKVWDFCHVFSRYLEG